jgi:hypothetical protein
MTQFGEVLIVYCIDAEGPLYESLEATFERIAERFDIHLPPSQATLRKLQQGDFEPKIREQIAGREAGLMNMISPTRLDFAADWKTLNERVARCFETEHRMLLPDSRGQGLVYSWFCVDRVGMDHNPRRRALGYHSIIENYLEWLRESPVASQDETYWHYHPISFFNEAHKCANNISHTNHHLQVLCRRVIDLGFFPVAFRPGCDVERPDINLFLEQWIPFDYGNVGGEQTEAEQQQADLAGGRYGDWRRAPRTWGTYHPSINDYQIPGTLNRYMARCRYAEGRVNKITQPDIDAAFRQARDTGQALLSFMSHDNRHLAAESEQVLEMVAQAAKRHPETPFRYVNAREGIQIYERLDPNRRPRLEVTVDGNMLVVRTDDELWGAQPFLCFKTVTNQYFHDNFDKQSGELFTYIFDDLTIDLAAIETIGVAANGKNGETEVRRLSVDKSNRKPNILEITA